VPIKEDVYCDFYIPKGKVYVEFWGLEDDEKYIKRKEQKIELYKKYNLNLIEIDNNTINNIDDYLPKELLKFGVSLDCRKKGASAPIIILVFGYILQLL